MFKQSLSCVFVNFISAVIKTPKMPIIKNPLKATLRHRIKETLGALPTESKQLQSKIIERKILSSEVYKKSKNIGIYLSTTSEVDTIEILKKMFHHRKHVFVPTYHGDSMEMVRLYGMVDYNRLPLTKWNIKQPNFDESRENALDEGLDLILMPGVAFTLDGGRLGHGMGYYDKYLAKYFEKFPHKRGTELKSIPEKLAAKKTILISLAFREQLVEKNALPLDVHDVILDDIVTCDQRRL